MTTEITPETLRLAEEGATVISDAVHGKNPTVTACLSQAAAIRDLIAHATETCEWKEDEKGNWYNTCADSFTVLNFKPSRRRHKFCHHCGKRIKETNFALTETKRPATTGEMMGEEEG